MPRLNGTGPENKGKQTGRGLGQCRKVENNEALEKLGKDMGVRRKSGGVQGQGNFFSSGLGRGKGRGFGKGLGLGRGQAMRFRGNGKNVATAMLQYSW